MPAIVAGVRGTTRLSIWHLGDYRALYMFDDDCRQLNPAATVQDYESNAWLDFIAHQLTPFGDLPVFLGIGNHELIPPQGRGLYMPQFADWLDTATAPVTPG